VTAGIQFFKNLGQTIIPSLLSAAMIHRLVALLQGVDWKGLPKSVVAPLKSGSNIASPGFINKFSNSLPEEMRESMREITAELANLLSSTISFVFWGAVAAVLITLIIHVLAREISLKGKTD
jgi:hypothetical protein